MQSGSWQKVVHAFTLHLLYVRLLVSDLFIDTFQLVLQPLHLLHVVALLVLVLFPLVELGVFLLDGGQGQLLRVH